MSFIKTENMNIGSAKASLQFFNRIAGKSSGPAEEFNFSSSIMAAMISSTLNEIAWIFSCANSSVSWSFRTSCRSQRKFLHFSWCWILLFPHWSSGSVNRSSGGSFLFQWVLYSFLLCGRGKLFSQVIYLVSSSSFSLFGLRFQTVLRWSLRYQLQTNITSYLHHRKLRGFDQ